MTDCILSNSTYYILSLHRSLGLSSAFSELLSYSNCSLYCETFIRILSYSMRSLSLWNFRKYYPILIELFTVKLYHKLSYSNLSLHCETSRNVILSQQSFSLWTALLNSITLNLASLLRPFFAPHCYYYFISYPILKLHYSVLFVSAFVSPQWFRIFLASSANSFAT